jgi:hypothetical protein
MAQNGVSWKSIAVYILIPLIGGGIATGAVLKFKEDNRQNERLEILEKQVQSDKETIRQLLEMKPTIETTGKKVDSLVVLLTERERQR